MAKTATETNHTLYDFANKYRLKEAVRRGEFVVLYQEPGEKKPKKNGRVVIESRKPGAWKATATLKNGVIVKVR